MIFKHTLKHAMISATKVNHTNYIKLSLVPSSLVQMTRV